ncbi:hypothetical protein [Algivirga pacifica]|uniref:Phosphoadenosine phosphosulphate reductase domain-containing protein n=1 Tax=Algivirga pacifica TaxID=1162670 RepID=A0ABP9DJA0_9BACT
MDRLLPLNSYDKIIVSMSGGKDSIACFLHLYEQENLDINKVEIWHNCIDGFDQWERRYFDWDSTEGYVREFAKEFCVPLLWSWRDFGMHGEMYKQNRRSHGIRYVYEHDLPDKSKVRHIPQGSGQTQRSYAIPFQTDGYEPTLV